MNPQSFYAFFFKLEKLEYPKIYICQYHTIMKFKLDTLNYLLIKN